jgi:glucose/arabinose dehydrogenase
MRSFGFALLVLFAIPLYAQSVDKQSSLGTKDIITGLDTPWEILWGPDNFIWIAERYGRISRVDPVTGDLYPIITIPEVYESAESGLMGMALHPHFPDPPYLYCAYTASITDSTYGIHIVRYTYAKDTLVDRQILVDPQKIVGGTIHEGCRLLIDSTDMTLYATTGDADDFYGNPQPDHKYNGKVLRMNLDGSVPADNPDSTSHVWSKGHRNAQGLAFGPQGILYETMHGTWEEDEINIIEKKGNYGWPFVNGYADLKDEQTFQKDSSTIDPIYTWTPTIAPAGCEYYNHNEFPAMRNSLLVAALKGDGSGNSYMIAIHLDSTYRGVVDTSRYLYGQYGRFRDVCISPEGRIFLATSNKDTKGTPREGDDRIVMLYDATTIGSVSEQDQIAIRLVPNPMTGSKARLIVPPALVGSHYTLIDALGRIVHSGTLDFSDQPIERGNLVKGVYILRIDGADPYAAQFIIN